MQIVERGGRVTFFSQQTVPHEPFFYAQSSLIQTVLFKILVPLVYAYGFQLFREKAVKCQGTS